MKSAILIVAGIAIFTILYTLFGQRIILLAACLSIVYMIWSTTNASTEKASNAKASNATNAANAANANAANVDHFLKADKQLVDALHQLQLESTAAPFDYIKIHDRLIEFLQVYLDSFVDQSIVHSNFQVLIDKRQDILTLIASLDQFSNVPISQEVVDAFEQGTWKYINALMKKYDIDDVYPVAYEKT